MDIARFDAILDRRMKETMKVLASKGGEYATGDRLHNFKATAAMLGQSPEMALMGFLAKHITSVIDIPNRGRSFTRETIDEKIGDCINYLCLLEALLIEQLEEE